MKNLFKLIICSIFFITSCGEDINEVITDDSAPGNVNVTRVENGPGVSRIYFNLPNSESFLFAEATFEDDGKTISAKASSYNNFVQLDGFSESKEYKVKLYSVSRGMNKSTPLEVVVHPELPPYKAVLNSLDIVAATGGFNVSFVNPSEADLALIIEKLDTETGLWEELDTYYRKDAEAKLKIRDQIGENLNYRIKIRDKFLHYSDYKDFVITPALEREMDYNLFAKVALANDPALFTISGTNLQPHTFLWNQKVFESLQGTGDGSWVGTTSAGGYAEHWMSWDLGKQAQLSRILIYQRGVNGTGSISPYTANNLQDFEVWASNDPTPDGAWESWTRILVEKIIKPAGSTADVLAASKNGDTYNFDEDLPKYRYLRLKCKTTFNASTSVRFYLAGIRVYEAL